MENFFNTILCQTLVLVLTACIPIWEYFRREKNKVRNAATIIMLQIEEIEKNVEYILSEGLLNGCIQDVSMHYSTIIFNENQWEKYSHLIVGKVSPQTFSQIDDYFQVAHRIREQQIFIKQKIQQSLDFKIIHYYNAVYTALDSDKNANNIPNIVKLYSETSVPPYIHLELARGLEKTLKQYHKLTDGMAYSELKKLK